MFEERMDLIKEFRYRLRQGNAIVQIILVNAAVFVLFAVTGVLLFLFNQVGILSVLRQYLMLPASLPTLLTQPWTLITYMFLHEGFIHILFNMLWLYWFGSLFQQYLGNSKTWQAYLLGGIFGGVIYIVAFNVFPAFSVQLGNAYALGASAGVLSLVFAAATLLPDYQVVLFLLGPVRLKYIALVSVFIDLLSIPNGNAGGHIAHLGGAFFGFLFVKMLYSNSKMPATLDAIFSTLGKLFVRKPSNVKIHYRSGKEVNAKPAQQEIDTILEKISKNGYDSLSKKEKEILFRAGRD